MNDKILEMVNVTKKYGATEVLHDTSLKIEPGKIYGLIGRNGAGKTTLLSIATGQNPPTSGTVTYAGQPVWENEQALGELCFSREIVVTFGSNAQSAYKGKDYLELARSYYPHWDEAYAQRLIQAFELDMSKKVSQWSKGMTSMLTITLGLASRAPITIMDEPVAGLDVAMRKRFYKLLLDDYEKTGRTFVVSTHIIEEAAPVFEKLLLIDKGELLVQEDTDDFLARYSYVSGKQQQVEQLTAGMKVINREGVGRQLTLCVELPPGAQRELERAEVHISPAPLQDVFVYLTGGEEEANIA